MRRLHTHKDHILRKKFLLALFFAALFLASTKTNTIVSAATFRPQINIINSSAPIPEPSPDNTGEIEWLENQFYEEGLGEEATVRIDYDLKLFKRLFINGKELIHPDDYYLDDGSTVIILTNDYMQTLPVGTYQLAAEYSDGQTFSTEFYITEDAAESSILVPNTGNWLMGSLSNSGFSMMPFVLAIIGMFVLFVIGRRVVHKKRTLYFEEKNATALNKKYAKFIEEIQNLLLNIWNKSKAKIHQNSSSYFIIHRKRILPATIAVSLALGFVCAWVLQTNLSSRNDDVIAISSEGNSLSFSTVTNDYNVELDLSGGSAFTYTSQEIIVDTAMENGYQLFISTDSSEYNDLSINGSISAEERITATSGTSTNPVILEEDSWGYAINNEFFGSNYVPSVESKWAGVPVLGAENLLKNVTSATPAGDATTVYYGFNVTNNLPDGQYWGTANHKVVYTVIANTIVEYDITYDCNGGTGTIGKQTKAEHKTITLSNGSGCSREGYAIKNWNTASNGSGVDYNLSAEYSDDNDLSLFAIWESTIPEAEERIYTLKYDVNGGTGVFENQTITTTAANASFTISAAIPTRQNYTFKGWSTNKNATVASYQPSRSITAVDIVTTLYAIWESNEPIAVEHTYTLAYNANGGSGAPSSQTITTTDNTVTFTINGSVPSRAGYTFKGWNIDRNATTATHQPNNSITVSSAATTLYAIWAINAPVKVSSIAISGASNINLNSSTPRTTLTATVAPANAANKAVTWSSSNNKVATVSSTGVVTGVEAGAVTITAKANDGSGVKATYTVTVKKKVLILLGASQILRIAGSDFANTKSYTDESSKNVYTTSAKTLNFFYIKGKGFQFQTGTNWSGSETDGWTRTKNLIQQYSGVKNYVEFYVYFTVSMNDFKWYTCNQVKSGVSLKNDTINVPTLQNQAKTYNDRIASLKNAGYNINGYVTSAHPMKANQATSKYMVYNKDSHACSTRYRSNLKYNTVNNAMKQQVNKSSNSLISFVDTFNDIVDTSNSNPGNWKYKSNWSSYSTTDGIHWNNDTAIKYFNYWMNKNPNL